MLGVSLCGVKRTRALRACVWLSSFDMISFHITITMMSFLQGNKRFQRYYR